MSCNHKIILWQFLHVACWLLLELLADTKGISKHWLLWEEMFSVSANVTFEAGVWEHVARESGKYIYLMICEWKTKKKRQRRRLTERKGVNGVSLSVSQRMWWLLLINLEREGKRCQVAQTERPSVCVGVCVCVCVNPLTSPSGEERAIRTCLWYEHTADSTHWPQPIFSQKNQHIFLSNKYILFDFKMFLNLLWLADCEDIIIINYYYSNNNYCLR